MRRTFPLQDLSDDEFEDLVAAICHFILGTGTFVFAAGKDGGRDGAFSGTAQKFPSTDSPLTGKFIVQSKHTANPVASCSDAEFARILEGEKPRIIALIAAAEVEHYLCFTNRKKPASDGISKEVDLKTLGLVSAHILGVEQIRQWLTLHPEVWTKLGFDRFETPFRIQTADLTAVITAFHEVLDTDGAGIVSGDFSYVTKPQKNKINKMSDAYFEEIRVRYRTGVSYFLRTQADYTDYFQIQKFMRGQDRAWKPYLAAVLGLDHEAVLQKYNLEEDIAKKEALRDARLAEVDPGNRDRGELATRIEIARDEISQIDTHLDGFDFHEVEVQINKRVVEAVEAKLNDLGQEMYDLEVDIAQLETSISSGIKFDLARIREIFAESEILFPDAVAKSYEDLVDFNRQLTRERNKALRDRVKELQKRHDTQWQNALWLMEAVRANGVSEAPPGFQAHQDISGLRGVLSAGKAERIVALEAWSGGICPSCHVKMPSDASDRLRRTRLVRCPKPRCGRYIVFVGV